MGLVPILSSPAMTPMTRPAPAEHGFRMPAEWAPHQATWISWPHNPETWPGCLEAAEDAMAQAVTALAGGETVRINVLDTAHEAHVRGRLGALADTPAVVFHHFPTNDAWCRDHGAIFVRNAAGELAAVDCTFNAWGGKYLPWELDDAIAARQPQRLGHARRDRVVQLPGRD